MEKIGLIAGRGKFPLIFANEAKKRGCFVVALAIKGDTISHLGRLVDKIYWISINQFGEMFEIFKREGIASVIMAGQVNPRHLFNKSLYRNEEIKGLLESVKDRKADSIFGAIAKRLEESGFKLIDSTTYLEDYLPQKGVLTEREPTFTEWEDIYFGLKLAKEIAFLDIGQTVGVQNKAIVAVEALEGTDSAIRRAGRIGRNNVVIVKVSKPKQDMRFDIPVVGLKTIQTAISSGVSSLAIEAGKTLFIDKDVSLRLANRKGIVIVAV